MSAVLSRHTQQVAALFDSVASTYDAVGVPWFVPIAERLVDELDIRAGEHVLDAGCGRGAAIPALAAAVGRAGRVVGIDVSHAMLEHAHRGVQLRGLTTVELHHMDATSPSFPVDSFNAVCSSLVLALLPDPVEALRRWHQILVPTGRIGLNTFGERAAVWNELDELFTPYLTAEQRAVVAQARRDDVETDAGVERLLTEAGFVGVRSVTWTIDVALQSPTQWRTWTMSHGMRALWYAVPETAREELLSRAAVILGRTAVGGPIRLGQTIRTTVAYRPRF